MQYGPCFLEVPMRFEKWCFLVLLLSLVTLSTLAAFSLTPMSYTFQTEGRGAVKSYTLENGGTEPVAVALTLVRWKMDEKGKESYEPIDGEFVLYPSRVVLMPGEKKSIRLQWTGKNQITVEKTFRLIAEQLPVSFQKEGTEPAGISILLKYQAAVYVAPENPEVQLELINRMADITPEKDNISIRFRNQGNTHAIFKDGYLRFTTPEGKLIGEYQIDAVTELSGQVVLARSERVFIIKLPEEVKRSEASTLFMEYVQTP